MQEESGVALGPTPGGPVPVDRVARERVSDGRQVDADLVRSTGHQVQLEKGPGSKSFADSIAGHRFTAVRHDSHAGSMVGVAADRRLDAPGRGGHCPQCQAQIRLLYAARLQLRHQTRLRLVVLRDHEQAAGIPIQAMYDPRPLHPGDATVLGVAGQQGVDQSSVPMAGCRMDDQARGFVDDQHVVVLVDDGERDRFGLELERYGVRHYQLQNPARDDRVAGLDGGARRGDVALGDEFLDVTA